VLLGLGLGLIGIRVNRVSVSIGLLRLTVYGGSFFGFNPEWVQRSVQNSLHQSKAIHSSVCYQQEKMSRVFTWNSRRVLSTAMMPDGIQRSSKQPGRSGNRYRHKVHMKHITDVGIYMMCAMLTIN